MEVAHARIENRHDYSGVSGLVVPRFGRIHVGIVGLIEVPLIAIPAVIGGGKGSVDADWFHPLDHRLLPIGGHRIFQ